MGTTKYLMSIGELHRKDNSLIFRNSKGSTHIPIEGVREFYCLNEISLNTKLLDILGRTGIIVHFFNYYQQYCGSFYPKKQLISGRLVVGQAMAFKQQRTEIAAQIVRGIAQNIHFVLYHYYRQGKKELKPFLDWLRKDVPKLATGEREIHQLLFFEGTIWKKFYETFSIFLPESFVFNKRVRRPPDNPMNALISFGNSLLYSKTITQIYRTHLDQSISFLHEPSEARFSLSLDLCEVFKPIIVFKTIFECINNRKLQVGKHFDKELNYCLLNEAGKKVFIQSFEKRAQSVFEHTNLKRKVSLQGAIKLDGYKLIKHITEGTPFIPFSMEVKR
ncbi:type I-B CRISPR-associated endonuclease Cas1b [Sporolactobacillus inulinus]|uniref:CRISPR-associated endonuclease Cas1 n=1 Tax=Sporolactobacillus inulinus CASD TaxID=1069536 RepID=A0A0U1QT18_9BACL|nr:type I-B CRISPR-associated endonuclease Cas1b [Sporolactobacillus inulinus]KLI03954.1 CRISPR-associated protein Cas1 [Sporolactobacillus inulinus CASD]GEB77860.1 CRISPR-associated endonuclease Cas1 [Sporolactobacillus inulinus]